MKLSEWKRRAGVVAEVLPQYRPMRFGFVRFDEWIAAGYYVDSSAFSSAAFYVQAFAMPRFVPADSLYFDYGFRVNGRWEEVGPDLAGAVAAAEPRLAEVATLDGLRAEASEQQRNINHVEVHLCTAVLTREESSFIEMKRAALNLVPEVPWEADVRNRCIELAELVEDQGFEAGEAILTGRRGEVDRLLA